jgi:tight adherence protein B
MSAAALAMLAVIAMGGALAPKPVSRRLQPEDPTSRAGVRSIQRLARRRTSGRVEPAALAAWCDSLARALRGGSTLRHAMCTVPPPACVETRLAPALLALERGASVVAALSNLDARSHDLDLVLVVVRACAEHGGEAAEPIDRAAAALRQRAALAGERRTNSAQARMSALVMTCLPVAMLALLALTSRSVRAASTSPAGLAAIALGAMLNVAGWGWMRRLIARATR